MKVPRLAPAPAAPAAAKEDTATVAANDYVFASGQLTFNPGETSQSITVLVKADRTIEPDEVLLFEIPVPQALIDSRGRKRITVTVAYDPQRVVAMGQTE